MTKERAAIGKTAGVSLVVVMVVIAVVAGIYVGISIGESSSSSTSHPSSNSSSNSRSSSTASTSSEPSSSSSTMETGQNEVVVDHSRNSFCVDCSSVSVILTTSHSDDVIYVVTYDSQTGPESVSVTSQPSLVWKPRITLSTPNDMATWYAVWPASGNLNITYRTGGVNTNDVIMAFGISGANTTSPFDTSPTVAAICSSLCTTNQTVTITTAHSSDFVIGAINAAGGGLMTGGQCCTNITGLSAGGLEFVLTSRPQTNLSLAYTSQQDPTRWMFIADAVVVP